MNTKLIFSLISGSPFIMIRKLWTKKKSFNIDSNEDIAVTKFRKYLRIKTAQPNPDYEAAKHFLFGLAHELEIPCITIEPINGKPFIVMTVAGTHPQLSSLMLYSHIDVATFEKEHWKHDPFASHKDLKGDIYGRGAQDMKSVGIQYFEAIRRHFDKGKKQWKRTIHLVYGSDEEIGGRQGMKEFCRTAFFQDIMNVGCVLDEGLPSPTNVYGIYYGERSAWWIKINCKGNAGHGALISENTAAEKVTNILNNIMSFRSIQLANLRENTKLQPGEMISVNVTKIEGGKEINVAPESISVYLDLRLPPSVDFGQMEGILQSWCKEAGEHVELEYIEKSTSKAISPITIDNTWFAALHNSIKTQGLKFKLQIHPASTDSMYLREIGIPAYGFSPIINTPPLLHDHNEYINEKTFLRGIEIYEDLIDALADS